jgi:hypothetical protein
MDQTRRPQRLQPCEIFARMMRGACQRACRDKSKSFGIGDRRQRLELVRRHEAHDGMMLARGLQILPDGEEIDVGGAQIVHHLEHFVALLAEPHHDSRFGEDLGIELLGALQELDGGEVACARTHGEIFRRHGFQVVVEHVRLRGNDGFDRPRFTQKVRRQHFDRGPCAAPADRADHSGEVRRAAVVEIVAVDGGDDDMRKAELLRGVGDVRRFGGIERAR